MDKFIQIREGYLEELLDRHSITLVGKTCKRFEILTDINQIKKDVKELVYEQFRSLIAEVKAYNDGGEEIINIKFRGRV